MKEKTTNTFALLLFAFSLLGMGCASAPTRTVYIPSDRRIEAVTNSIGIACQAVPNGVFAEMLVKIQRLADKERAAEAEARIK